MRNMAIAFLAGLGLSVLMAQCALAGTAEEDAWQHVAILSPAEAASYAGGTYTGRCTGDDQRDDCEDSEEQRKLPPCIDRTNPEACESGQWTVIDWYAISWCAGWPNGPKYCYNMGTAMCSQQVECLWIAGEGCSEHDWKFTWKPHDDCTTNPPPS